MSELNPTISKIINNLHELRVRSNISETAIEERLIIGPGWIAQFESGKTIPNLDMLLAILNQIGASPNDLFDDLPKMDHTAEVERLLFAIPKGDDLLIKFRYTKYNAQYHLKNASLTEFEIILKTLRDGLAALTMCANNAEAIKTQAVARSFLKAVEIWPHANPSDLWWFLIYRAYCDPFNHPAKCAGMDLSQSWKRTAGWALEEVLVQHYGPFLKEQGINMFIAHGEHKEKLIAQLQAKVKERLESDKVDVVLTTTNKGDENCFGVVHVKASFAERRSDDEPLSKALIEANYLSLFWTMDCKSIPSSMPENLGELGELLDSSGKDKRSAKRKDFEDDGKFSSCFSYNQNTKPTPLSQSTKTRIVVCNFRGVDDEFTRFIIEHQPIPR